MQENIKQTVKDSEYAATSATGDATIYITNYYYSEKSNSPIKTSEIVAEEKGLCPYRGLFHFGPNDAKFFFGRNTFIEKLYKAVQISNFIPVIGASGSGKSSAVLAGLIPKLQEEGYWQFTHFRPGKEPFHALALALVPLYTPKLDETDRIAQARKLAGYLIKNEISLSDVFSQILQNNLNHRVLLIADQFEELYTQCIDNTVRHTFLDCLLASFQASSSDTAPSIVLVATLRADFLGDALSYSPFVDVLQNSDVKLGAMNRSELLQVIEKPAELVGIKFEEGLVERILDDVENEPGNLPLLEFALTELWEKQTGKKMTHTAYEAIGQVKGAIADYADEKYKNLTSDDQKRAQQIFIQLVSPGEGSVDTRRRANRHDLDEKNWNLIIRKDGLADSRLVVTGLNNGQETVEIVHEALIKNWSQLRLWMDINREFRDWQEQLRADIYQWQKSKEDEGALLHGKPLLDAEAWLNRRGDEIGWEERNYIKKSLDLHKYLSKSY